MVVDIDKINPEDVSADSSEDLSGWISYKNPELLTKFISETYKILPRRHTGLSALQQRTLKEQLNIARILGIMAFTVQRKKVTT